MSGPEPTANEDNAVIWPELWSAFEPHRQKVFGILSSLSRGPQSSLCVWGAGRTTDLDLINLLNHFAAIDLVDFEPDLTQAALVQRGFDEHSNVKAIASFDVSGMQGTWEKFYASPSEKVLGEIIEVSPKVSLELGKYDVVVSTCMLSQVVRQACEAVESSGLPDSTIQEYFPKVIRAIRDRHIELMVDHTLPGGSAVLVLDCTSSESLPEILAQNADLSRLVKTQVAQGNHFHGMNPFVISEFMQQSHLASELADIQISAPWIWDALQSQYLCMAFRMQKK